jgi:predicted Zn-dependent protease
MTLTKIPTIFDREEALSFIDSVITRSQAESVFVSLSSSESALSRFSENQIGQNISKNRFKLNITSYFGKRSASASTTELDNEAIAETLKRSEELARFAPEDPEWVPLLTKQTYDRRIAAFDSATANLSPLERGEIVRDVCSACQNSGVDGSGTLSTSTSLNAIGNSLGVSAVSQTTEADFSITTRIDNGSSWNSRTAWSLEQIPFAEMTDRVIQRSIQSRQPREVKPGVYTVIFDAAATSSLIPWIVWNLDARAADEGRSFMSKMDDRGTPIGNRLGERLFSPLVQIQRNPAHLLLQSAPFFSDGLSNNYLDIIKDGIPEQLAYSRYWAQQKQTQPTGDLYPIVMTGSDRDTSSLIAETERGILVSRAWYVRYVNPRTLEVTGMTRDGTFWIEDGQIAYPIKNLRFNQNLPEMLSNVEAIGKVERFNSSVMPSLKVKQFNFSSITDSI